MTESGLVERLKNGGNIVIAEGYMWEFERRGYLTAGGFIPEVILEHPELVRQMHEEFVHAGTDVVEAFMYFGHRQKLRQIGREDDLEKLNLTALRIARDVAKAHGKLFAGAVCNSGVYNPHDEESIQETNEAFREQIEWAVQEGVDYMIGETFNDFGEAMLALRAIQKYGKGVPAVITMTAYVPDESTDDVPIPEACRRLEEAGAAVVGLNCGRGPRTMLPLLKEIRKVCKGPLAALPVPYRCTDDARTFQSLKDAVTGEYVYPADVACFSCSRKDIRDFAEAATEIGVNYIGLCCGNSGAYMREVAKVYGRKTEASKYFTDMSLSVVFGDGAEKESYKIHASKIGKYVKGLTKD